MGHVLILFGRYFRMFVRNRFCCLACEVKRNGRVGLSSPSGSPGYGRGKPGYQSIASPIFGIFSNCPVIPLMIGLEQYEIIEGGIRV
jgi:hypothetical protein